MWKVIVESENGLGGTESAFEFKYIPDLSKRTLREDAAPVPKVGEKKKLENGGENAEGKTVWGKTGVERRNAQALGVASLFLLGMGWVGWRVGVYGLRMWYDTTYM